METCGSTSNPDRNLESGPGNGDNTSEDDSNFDYLTIETSGEMEQTRRPLAALDEPMVQQSDFHRQDIPTFYEIIPSLQEISSLKVAIFLWKRVLSLKYNPNFDSITKIDRQEVEQLLLELPVPGKIREIVKSHLTRVANEMKCWLQYYSIDILLSGEGTTNLGDLTFCCWLPDGKIDHRASALNMLSNPRLTRIEKFNIMCRFCLEEEVKKLSIKLLPPDFIKSISFEKNALNYYWLCYMTNNLDKFPKISGESVESYLITDVNVNTWSAIEYFWHRLNVDEQTCKIEPLIDLRPEFQKNLFSIMNELQKFHILSKIPNEIMAYFWEQPGQERFAYTTWLYIRNFVDYEQFDQIVCNLCEYSLNIDEKIRCMVDIWNSCPEHLKNLAFQPSFLDLILSFQTDHHHYSNIDLLLAYLSHFSAEQRKKILFERAHTFVIWIDNSATDELIKLCLPNDNDVIEFKNYVLNSRSIQDQLCEELHGVQIDILNNFLSYYCRDSYTRSELCCKILNLCTVRGCPFDEIESWITIVQFINENISLNFPDQALKFKKEIVWLFAKVCCELWSCVDNLAKMIDVVTEVFDAEELVLFKVNALDSVQTRYRWAEFDENIIGGFLSWCYNNDRQKIRQFVETLSIDGIFECAWNSLKWRIEVLQIETNVDYETIFKFLEPLDKCLFWYFEDSEEVKRFKLEKVFAYCDKGTSVFDSFIFKPNYGLMKKTLPWFFEGNQDAIELFKEMYQNEYIAQMI